MNSQNSSNSVAEHLTIRELAQTIRASRATVYNLISSGNGPRVTKVGGKTLFDRNDVTAWLESCKRETLGRVA